MWARSAAFRPSSWSASTRSARRCSCGRWACATWRACASPSSWAASTPISTWRCGAATSPPISRPATSRPCSPASARDADLLKLVNQPLTWGGATNPFALLPHQRAANYAFSGGLIPDFDALLRARTNAAARKKMRKKERTLAGYGAVRFARAEGQRDIRHALDVFFKQKSARMRAHGLHDVFADPNVRRFIEDAATTPRPDGKPLIELYALSVDDMIVATMGGIVGRGRFCAMFNSITSGRYAVESPGEQLIVQLVRQCCERGLDTFDLGIGEARYKNLFCNDAEPLFDSFLPLSAAGWLPAASYRAGRRGQAHDQAARLVVVAGARWRAACGRGCRRRPEPSAASFRSRRLPPGRRPRTR